MCSPATTEALECGLRHKSWPLIKSNFFQLRGTVSSFANVAAKMSNFVQMKWFTSLCDLIGLHWTFLFFSVVSFFACFYSLFYFPETRQKSVAEIYEKLEGKKKKKKTEEVPQTFRCLTSTLYSTVYFQVDEQKFTLVLGYLTVSDGNYYIQSYRCRPDIRTDSSPQYFCRTCALVQSATKITYLI